MSADSPSDATPPPSPSSTDAGDPLHPVDWAVKVGAVDPLLHAMEGHVRRNRRRRWRVAIAGAFAVLAAGFYWQGGFLPSGPQDGASRASLIVSLPARQVLADGSVVDLKDNAEIAVDYQGPLRRVLLHRGEAHFEVAHDPQKPFVVVAGDFQVQAVGTAFFVDRGATAVEVLVTEGRVAVEPSNPDSLPSSSGHDSAPRPRAIVDAGNRLIVESGISPVPRVQSLSEGEISQRMAWRVPRLEFSGTPLHEILPLVARHSGVRLTLSDPELGRVELSGTLRADNVEMLLALLEEGYGIATQRLATAEIVLRKVK